MIKKQLPAVILCCVFIVFLAAMEIIDKINASSQQQLYDIVAQDEQRSAQELESLRQTQEDKLEKANADLSLITQAYFPGITFFGDSIYQSESGISYPAVLCALIENDVCKADADFVQVDQDGVWEYDANFPVVAIGLENGWDSDINSLIELQKKFIAGHDRYIIIGIPSGTREERSEMEAAMEAEYGERYINLREYFSTEGLSSLRLEIYPEDEQAMENGSTPPSLMSRDKIHLNDNGYKLIAFLAYERMTDLGYFDEILAAKATVEELSTQATGAVE